MSGFDVIVAGGGPAGAAAALTLLRYSRLRVALVEESRYERVRVGETVPPGIVPLLAYLGVEGPFLDAGHLPAYASRAAWGAPHAVTRDFLFTGRGDGWHLDRARFDRMLAECVAQAGGTVVSPARVGGCAGGPGRWEVEVAHRGGGAARLAARYLVDATGRRASLARARGARRQVHDRLVGVTGYWTGSGGDPDGATLVETVPDGWWYSAALPDGRRVAALMTDVDEVRARGLHRADALQDALDEASLTRARLAGTRLSGPPVVRPAHCQLLRPAVGEGWIAAGDAAASFDPLSSMGIGHALSSGIQAGRVAFDVLEHDGALAAGYDDAVARHFREFLALRRMHYAAERRWADRPFWARRVVDAAAPV